jgi:hyaluronate lyase
LDNDLTQYNDAFWDTVDMYRLPGTTADSGALANSAGASTKPATTWVGGSVLAGTYGAVGMRFQDFSTNLTAVKSWFCLDTAVVALGAGITSTSGNAVITTVENRNLHAIGNNTLTINGATQSTSAGWSSTVSGVHYANISGVAGYYFLWPAGANDIEFALTNQTGSWSEVTTGGSTTTDTRPYLSIAFDHGANPTDATYSYVILPNFTEAQTAAYAANPTVSVIANEPTLQAITDSTLGVTMANFFAAGTAGPITVTAPASVSTQIAGSELTIAVSDPTWTAATVHVTIAESGYTSIVSADRTVTVLSSTGGVITLLVETGGSRGASHSVTLSSSGTTLTPSTAYLLAPTDNTYVRGGTYDTENFNGGTTMVVKNSGGAYDRVSLLKFATTGVTGSVARAILWVNGYVADSGGDQTGLTAYALSNDTWSASTVTFDTAPGVTTAYGSGQISNTADWVGLDVTGLVTAGGETAVGIWQESTSTCLAVLLYTTAEGSAYSPVLEVITS